MRRFERGVVRGVLLLWGAVGSTACGPGFAALDVEAVRGSRSVSESPDGWRVVEDRKEVRFLEGGGSEAEVETQTRVVLAFVAPKIHTWTQQFWYASSDGGPPQVRARLTQPDGKVKIFTDENASDESASGGVYVTDGRYRRLRVDGIRDGSILEFESTGRARDQGRASHLFGFGGPAPVGRAELLVKLPASHSIDWASEPPGFAPTLSREGETTVMVWRREAIPPLQEEAHGPRAYELAQRVRYRLRGWPGGAPIRTAQEVSAWADSLNAPRAVPTPLIRRTVADILGAEKLPAVERVRRISEWVRRKVRYVAIEIGLAGWQAQPADFTLDRLYGDCKAKAVLLKSMLGAADVPSRLALIESGNESSTYRPIDAAANFNHMVVLVDLPEATQLVDPTATHVPFGDVPFSDQDKDVLPVSPEGAAPVHEPLAPATANGTETVVTLEIDDRGRSKGRFRYRSRGAVAAGLRQTLAPVTSTTWVKSAVDWLPLGGLTLDTVEARSLEAVMERTPVDLEGDLHRSVDFVLRGETAALRLVDLLDACFPRPSTGQRKSAAVFGPPRQDTLELSLMLPEGWHASPPAAPASTRTAAGAYTLTVTAEGQKVTVRRTCERNRIRLEPSEYELFRDLSGAAMAAEGRPIVLRKEAK